MKNRSNVIPFPKAQQPTSNSGQTPPPPRKPTIKKKVTVNPSLAATVLSLFAIALAAGASNRSVFKQNEGWVDVASLSADDRGIASVEPSVTDIRDAAWEKSIAESLASAEVRDIASVSVGHEASLDEKVRFGVLERKYTILRDLKRNEVESITLQGSSSKPSFVMDRSQFLGQFGRWISEKYGTSELKSSEVKQDRRYEAFTIFDRKHTAYATAKFELDNYQRLLSFHLEPIADSQGI
jgi:hypothetical protein